jgi:hypothetical protein
MNFSEIPSSYFYYSARAIPKFRPAVVLQQDYFPRENLQHKLNIKTMLTKYFLGGHARYVKKNQWITEAFSSKGETIGGYEFMLVTVSQIHHSKKKNGRNHL